VLTTLSGRLVSGGGQLLGNLKVDVAIGISEDVARRRALQLAGEALSRRPDELHGDKGHLAVQRDRRLAWQFDVFTTNPIAGRFIEIDASNGTILTDRAIRPTR